MWNKRWRKNKIKEKQITGNEFIHSLKAKYENHDELMAEARTAINLDISIYEKLQSLKITRKDSALNSPLEYSNKEACNVKYI